jgi:hypothetical protein
MRWNISRQKKDQSTMLSNPTETTVKCQILVSRMLTRAFVTAGVRDATAGICNIRDRVRGATHLRRRRRAENWDIMAVGVKGEDGVWCGSELLKRPTARQWRGRSSPCEFLAFWFRYGPKSTDVFPAGSQLVEHSPPQRFAQSIALE